MLLNVQTDQILFIDIETVSGHAHFDELSEPMQSFWEKKYQTQKKRQPERYEDTTIDEAYKNEAAIFAEFGKIICISVGVVSTLVGIKQLRVKSFKGHNEQELLVEFAQMLEKQRGRDYNLCGHNIKEFDIPYIARRMLIHGINLPALINVAGKKPWEVKFIDTLDLWKFGDFKNYTSLSLLATLFGIPTPKDDIDGSEVGKVYYEENNIDRIARYCEKDVIATAQLFFKMNGDTLISEENIEHK